MTPFTQTSVLRAIIYIQRSYTLFRIHALTSFGDFQALVTCRHTTQINCDIQLLYK